jgi:hypothetical protein
MAGARKTRGCRLDIEYDHEYDHMFVIIDIESPLQSPALYLDFVTSACMNVMARVRVEMEILPDCMCAKALIPTP